MPTSWAACIAVAIIIINMNSVFIEKMPTRNGHRVKIKRARRREMGNAENVVFTFLWSEQVGVARSRSEWKAASFRCSRSERGLRQAPGELMKCAIIGKRIA